LTALTWAILTGEYPPQRGGVSDYTRRVARALVAAGDLVHVWAPGEADEEDDGEVRVHRLAGGFDPRSLRALGAALDGLPADRQLLVQYVPHAFGWRGMNVPFCLWLFARRREPLSVFFHEVTFPFGGPRPFVHGLLATTTRLMAHLLLRAADSVLVSTSSWEPLLRKLGPVGRITWLPIPSNVATVADPELARARRLALASGRTLIGHFGTFGAATAPLLSRILPAVLGTDHVALLIGRGGKEFAAKLGRAHPELGPRLVATGELAEEDLPLTLAACDVLLQPYLDGVTTRRTSVMAGLALGVPTISNEGPLTEAIWRETGAIELVGDVTPEAWARACRALLEGGEHAAALGAQGRAVYHERFDLRCTVEGLRLPARTA
jgi:glycosyltransferase involved in cell wall biosynthesis